MYVLYPSKPIKAEAIKPVDGVYVLDRHKADPGLHARFADNWADAEKFLAANHPNFAVDRLP